MNERFGITSPKPEPTIDNAEMRRILNEHIRSKTVQPGLIEGCPYCGGKDTMKYKIYRHPKEGDCVGVYTCADCKRRYLRQTPVHAEVW